MIVALVGLAREARIIAGPQVIPVIGKAALENALTQGPQGIISIGVAGALKPTLKTGDCVVATHVVDGISQFAANADWTSGMLARLPGTIAAVVAGADSIIATPQAKAALYQATGAAAVDMESHIAARAAATRRIPFAVLRVILDAADQSLPPAALRARRNDGTISLGAVLGSVLGDARQIPALIRTGIEAEIAFAALLRCRSALGPRLAGPDLG